MFFDYWTLKEAYIKARGFGLALPLGDFAFHLSPTARPSISIEPSLQRRPGHLAVPAGLADAQPSAGPGHPPHRRRPAGAHAPRRAVKLWAISDLHVGYEENRRAVEALPAFPDDWLIIAGDTGETPAHLDFVLRSLGAKFAQLIWTPGNHDLWTPKTLPPDRARRRPLRSAGRRCAAGTACSRRKIRTPKWPGDGPLRAIVPTFTLFDYSFRPDHVAREDAVAWAAETGVRSADEDLLAPDPYADLRRLVRRPRRGHRSAAGRAAAGGEADRRQPLPAAARPGRAAAHSALLDLVRNDAHQRLASPLQLRDGRLRATCTCARRARSTASSSKRCRWAIRSSGTSPADVEHYLRRII